MIDAKIDEVRDQVNQHRAALDQSLAELEWLETGRQFVGSDGGNATGTRSKETTSSQNGRPTLREAILRVMGEKPSRTWPASAVIRDLKKRNWLPSGEFGEHHTRSMLARMYRSNELKRPKRGHYRLPPEKKT
jgi:hypothetical protein